MDYDHKVLIVEDELQVGKLIASILKTISVSSVYASDGMEALYKIEKMKKPFSLIICDQRMPRMKGTELLEKVSRISPDTVRFLSTGYADISAIIQAVNRGKIHKYIPKPWQAEQLLEDFKAGLKQYELAMENENLFHIAKSQNSKLFALNRELKQNAVKQTKMLSALEEELRVAYGKTGRIGDLSSDGDESSLFQIVKKKIRARGITDETKINLLFEIAVGELYCRFQKIAFKKGFEIDIHSLDI